MANPSIRQDVVDELVADLEAMVAGADYHYTPSQVFRWRTPPVDALEFPSYAVLDLDESVEVRNYALEENRLRVTIQGIGLAHADDEGGGSDDPDTVARNLIADIRRAAASDGTGLSSGALSRLVTGTRLFVDAPVEPYVVVEVDVEILYRIRFGAPDLEVP